MLASVVQALVLVAAVATDPVARGPQHNESWVNANATDANRRADRDAFRRALVELAAAMRAADDEPATHTATLRRAIDKLRKNDVALATTTLARERLTVARLTLARAYLAIDAVDLARATLDEAIVAAHEAELPTASFGPALDALYRKRAAAVAAAGHTTLIVNCARACRIFVDTVPVVDWQLELAVGEHQLLVIDTADEEHRWRTRVSLSVATAEHTVHWPPPGATLDGVAPIERAATNPAGASDRHSPSDAAPRATPPPRSTLTDAVAMKPVVSVPRVLPRWLEITGVVLGTGAVATGATLVRLHHTCPGDLRRDPSTCPLLFSTRTGGLVALSSGGALLAGSLVLLGIDAARRDSARRGTFAHTRPH